MNHLKIFDVAVIGGSYAGLSAAMSLGRAIRKVLIIDAGKPCNIQTPHSHNFLTQDGNTPIEIAELAKKQVLAYPTVQLITDSATSVTGSNYEFEISTHQNGSFFAKKIIFSTGVRDNMPDIPGFSQSWGISVIHCPYCHGYEFRGRKTGIFINGEHAFEFGRLIKNWTDHLTIFTNGQATFDRETFAEIEALGIKIVETEIASIEHNNGQIRSLAFKNGTSDELDALYARISFEQHCKIPEVLGCTISDAGHIVVDDFQLTSIPGIYAAGDCTTPMRSVSLSVSTGNKAGAFVNQALISER